MIQICKHVANKLGQHYVVLTADEALFCKVMELKWAKEEYQNLLVVRLGGLHISLNFMKVIGKHMDCSGLVEAWVESNLLGPKTAEQVMAGKSYIRGMRSHKLTLQAMWRILLPQLLQYINKEKRELRQEIEDNVQKEDTDALLSLLASKQFRDLVDGFVASSDGSNFQFWWTYMKMVEILLMFTRASRDGDWKLHLHAFTSMLPYMMRYDQTNYARWGSVYVSEMQQLPEEVKAEFEAGNFVVKRGKQLFNQVDPDQSQEWLNGTGKKCGGIVGITKTPSALSRWALSYNMRSHISCETREAFDTDLDDIVNHNECNRGRRRQDKKDEDSLFTTLKNFKLFSSDVPQELQNIATKDLAHKSIEEDLLTAQLAERPSSVEHICGRETAPSC